MSGKLSATEEPANGFSLREDALRRHDDVTEDARRLQRGAGRAAPALAARRVDVPFENGFSATSRFARMACWMSKS